MIIQLEKGTSSDCLIEMSAWTAAHQHELAKLLGKAASKWRCDVTIADKSWDFSLGRRPVDSGHPLARMDIEAKKTALRMIPYGLYVVTADDDRGNIVGCTVNWVTQTSFSPPLVVVGVKVDSGAYQVIKGTKNFTLNMLGKEHKGLAFTFFKPAQFTEGKLSGQAIHKGTNGAPILDAALAAIECKVTSIVEQGDHHIIVGEVTEAHVQKPTEGRPDVAVLEMKDLGDKVYYGG